MTVLPLRPELQGVQPYGAPQLRVAVALNVNENPYPPPAVVVQRIAAAVADAAADLNRYPDREALALRTDLAAYLGEGLSAERVWAANGSNEVMLQLLQAYGGPGRTALSFAPTYSMYPEYARATSTRWLTGRRTDRFEIDVTAARRLIAAEQPSVIFACSPNNPTGTALPIGTVRDLLEAAPGLVVVDEAYAEFRRDGVPSAASLLDDYPNLVVTRTLSKAFALAGARVGYCAASPEVVDALRVVRLPYHLSAITQAVARAALASAGDLLGRVAEVRVERDDTVAWLRAAGLRAADSDANFVLFGQFADRSAVWRGLLARGVLIRETGPAGWLRVSIGTAPDMAAFRVALTEVLEELAG
jgi:histidinol-phosphate aminotransferase